MLTWNKTFRVRMGVDRLANLIAFKSCGEDKRHVALAFTCRYECQPMEHGIVDLVKQLSSSVEQQEIVVSLTQTKRKSELRCVKDRVRKRLLDRESRCVQRPTYNNVQHTDQSVLDCFRTPVMVQPSQLEFSDIILRNNDFSAARILGDGVSNHRMRG